MESTREVTRYNKMFVTFGQVHVHSVNGKTFDKDCVAVINAETYTEGREKAFKYFGNKFCFCYYEGEWSLDDVSWYPRGYINVEYSVNNSTIKIIGVDSASSTTSSMASAIILSDEDE